MNASDVRSHDIVCLIYDVIMSVDVCLCECGPIACRGCLRCRCYVTVIRMFEELLEVVMAVINIMRVRFMSKPVE